MLNNLFGAKKKTLERLSTNAWKDQAELEALCEDLKKTTTAREVVSLLSHPNTTVRSAAVTVFLESPDEKAAVELVASAGDQPPAVRGFMLRVVGRLPESMQLRVVNAFLADKQPSRVRIGWEAALSVTGSSRFALLERAVAEGPAIVRQAAAQRLTTERPVSAQLDLVIELAKDADAKVAQTAFEALSTTRDPRVMPAMLELFAGTDRVSRQRATAWIKLAAKDAPELVRKRMLDVLASGEDDVRNHCIEVILATGPAVITVGQILDFSLALPGWVRTRILESLKNFGEEVLQAALVLLDHSDDEVRTTALALCENLEDPRVVEPIARMLTDADWWMRISACDTLARLKDTRAVPHLVRALEDNDTRWAAIEALSQLGSWEAVRPLVKLLRDPRVEIRLEIVRALVRFPDGRLLPVLQQLRERDPSSEVRTRAAEMMRDLESQIGGDGSKATDAGTSAVSSESLSKPMDQLLALARERGYSDVHVTVGEPPFVRQNGVLVRLEGAQPLGEEQARKMIVEILDERQLALLHASGEVDFCHAIPEVGRYRANAFVQRRGVAANFRVIPNVPPTFGELGLPPHLAELLDYHQGLILVSGPAGSGKSTTLAAIVNLINETKADHVLTLEDPIEFAHPVKTALVNQREVVKHTESFARALRAALREDPDVIVVGEMRDVDTIRLALTAAETGHLVVGTLHTTGAVATIERMVTAFPPDEQPQVRMALSESLKYIVSQSLLPRADGSGRVAVFEVLKGTPSIGSLIRDNKSFQIPGMMQIGRSVGMMTREMAIAELVERGVISEHYLHGGKTEAPPPA